MAGVKIEQGTLTHRKTLRLKGLLGIGVAQAVGHLTMLWVWAANSTKDGSLAGDADGNRRGFRVGRRTGRLSGGHDRCRLHRRSTRRLPAP